MHLPTAPTCPTLPALDLAGSDTGDLITVRSAAIAVVRTVTDPTGGSQ